MIIAEHTVVRLISKVVSSVVTFEAGTLGTVISVYDKGAAYAVEIGDGLNYSHIICAPADILEIVFT